MDCAEAKLQMDPYAADQLTGAEKAAFESHLSDCAECRLDSELTRASNNMPTASQPRPAAAEAAPRPSAGEWTIESIFGSATGSGTGTSSARTAAAAPLSGIESGSAYTAPTESGPAAEPPPMDETPPMDEPEIPLPDVLLEAALARSGSAKGADANGTPGWKFESADAKDDVAPPEGSLFFAEEALSRTGTPAKAKSSFLRVILWGAGGIVGLALLGISIWVALTLKPPTSHVSEISRAPAASVAPAGEAPAAQSGAAAAPEAAPVPSTTPVAEPPRTSHNAETASRPAVDPSPAPPPPRIAESAPPQSAPPPSTPPPQSAPPRTAEAGPERPLWEPAIREEPSVQAPPRRSQSQSRPPSSPVAESPAAATPESAPKPKLARPPPAQEAAPPADPIQRPIDRLHLATLTAEQNADLAGLRKMRETWKTFLKTSVGPDRARAKRELGDCLWAVQILTANKSDQKAALAAYRDYVLNAPAGGADVRTVSRMRQLEDALAESH